jgi:hypothetical protein
MTFYRLHAELTDLAIISWPVPVARLAPMLPYPLVPQTFDDAGETGLVSMAFMFDTTFRKRYPQLNERTYVKRRDGAGAGAFFWRSHAKTEQAEVFRNILGVPIYYCDLEIDHDAGRLEVRHEGRQVATLNVTLLLDPTAPSASYPKLDVERAIRHSSNPMIGYTMNWGMLCATPVYHTAIQAQRVTVGNVDPSFMIPASIIDRAKLADPLMAAYQRATPFVIDLPPRPVFAACRPSWSRAFLPGAI